MRTSLWLILWFTSCTATDPANSDQESLINDGMVDRHRSDAASGDASIPSADLPPRARCPEFMVQIPGTTADFCIDQYESSTMRIIPTGGEEPWPFDRPVDGQTVRAVVRPGQKPQAYISGAQASDACKRSGKRLCSESEWLAACQGSAHYTYPYGNTYAVSYTHLDVYKRQRQSPCLAAFGRSLVTVESTYLPDETAEALCTGLPSGAGSSDRNG